ncbi:bifunctional adenosylcobinamide kinase/adenosylcobinamide-phosphate guanylyltransferase [Kribbia dieselivorans]|uniref:bifunctional adenosylcobinamide kinase/adenosylcobinamide-phosphate guanylyltransferase n=1 Tax=Kribbia dieselivorans TaxID=331526 RepID=UPI000837C335|nr:bifunctional adenosylcobinamide kinase/adenosylcobinamide-phosphate guanylyltransferase [Kribbia dieselivorans]
MKILVTGGVRSGKSRHAEELMSSSQFQSGDPTSSESTSSEATSSDSASTALTPSEYPSTAFTSMAPTITYVAPGPTTDEDTDPDWAHRIRAHQARRPAHWVTLETRDLAAALRTPGPVLVDCLGTWLTAVLDERALWDAPSDEVVTTIRALVDEATAILETRDEVVLVTNEVGLGVVPEHRSGRLFRDLLGTVNQGFAAACDEVHLVVAGRVLRL